MKTRKILLCILTIVCMVLAPLSFAENEKGFQDLDQKFWGYDKILLFLEDGYVSGYDDGTFKPNKYITRAEFVKIVNNFLEYDSTDTNESKFPDVKQNTWYIGYINEAYKRGYIEGYEDGTFRPEDPIRRQEAIVIIARILGIDKDTFDAQSLSAKMQFTDQNQIQDWAYQAVSSFAMHGFVSGYEDGSLRILNNITRAETIEILHSVGTKTGRISSSKLVNEDNNEELISSGEEEAIVSGEMLIPTIVPTEVVVPTGVATPIPTKTSSTGSGSSGGSSPRPTKAPTTTPTMTPTMTPTLTPTMTPTMTPTLTPTMTPTEVPKYTITWKAEDGTVLEVDEDVNEGSTPSFDGTVPDKEETKKATYEFKGWTKDGENVVTLADEVVGDDTTYTVMYEEIIKTFTITWARIDFDDDTGEPIFTLLEKDEEVPYGSVPSYDSPLPLSAPVVVGNYEYYDVFHGWYSIYGYDVTDYGSPEECLAAYNEEVNTAMNNGTPPPPNINKPMLVIRNMTYIASIEPGAISLPLNSIDNTAEYTITWKNEDGTILEVDENVQGGTMLSYDGPTPTKEDDEYVYQFIGWDNPVCRANGDETFVAQYTKTKLSDLDAAYTVTWGFFTDEDADSQEHIITFNPDRILAVEEGLSYGDMPTLNVDKPDYADWVNLNEYNHDKISRDNWVGPVIEDTIYVYYVEKDAFTVTWIDEAGNVLEVDENVPIGAIPQFDGEMPAEALGWMRLGGENSGLEKVFEDVTYVAYEHTFTVTWGYYKIDQHPGYSPERGRNPLEYFVLEVDENVPYGAIPTCETPLPRDMYKDVGGVFNLTEGRWMESGIEPITKDTVFAFYACQYSTVTWLAEDESTLFMSEDVIPSTIPVFEGDYPDNFICWKNYNTGAYEVTPAMKEDECYIAVCGPLSVAWIDEEGNLLELDEDVEFESVPSFDGVLPEGFKAWTKVINNGDGTYTKNSELGITEVREKTIYMALTKTEFTVTWGYLDSRQDNYEELPMIVLEVDENVPYGSTPSYDGIEPDYYEGWINAETGDEIVPITEDVSYYFVYYANDIYWYDAEWNECLYVSRNVGFLETPVFEGDLPENFLAWKNIRTGEIGVIPTTGYDVYVAICGPLTVTWQDEEGNILEIDEDVELGSMPQFNGEMPEGAIGWQALGSSHTGLNIVQENVVYIAYQHTYTVTWKDKDGTILEVDENVPYGVLPTYQGNRQLDYFEVWEDDNGLQVSPVTGDTTYYISMGGPV